MNVALLGVDEQSIPIQRVRDDAFDLNNERNGKRLRYDCRMRTDRPFFQNCALQFPAGLFGLPAVIQQFARTYVAGDENRSVRNALRLRASLSGQYPKQSIEHVV